MTYTVDEVRERVTEAISQYSNAHLVKRIGVFGSVARGNPKEDSDIDLLVDFVYDDYNDDDPASALRNWFVFDGLLRAAFRPIDLSVIDIDAPRDSGDMVMQKEIDRDVVWIYGS